MNNWLQIAITFGVPLVALILMLAPFFVFRHARGWLGDWRGAVARYIFGTGIGVLIIDISARLSYTIEELIKDGVVFVFFAILIFFFIWPFFGFNLLRGNKLTKSIIFQLVVGLINLALGIMVLIMAIPWGLSALGGF